jgi:hypothetical protein
LRHFAFLLCLVSSLALSACSTEPEPSDDDDDVAELPAIIPGSWFTGASGTILNRKEFVSGALEGESCTESFGVNGVNVTDVLPDICSSCDLSYTVYLALEAGTDCHGGDDLDEESKMAFDLRQESDEAILYWYSENWWNAEWIEMGTGTLVRDDDSLTFDFHFEWEDPDNGEWAGNWTGDEPCSWGDTCSWDGFYTSDLTISFDWNGADSNPAP